MTNHLKNAQLELQAAFDLGEIPPHDTLDRALWRARFILSTSLYDEFEIEPEQAIGDLIADLYHLCDNLDLDLDNAIDRGFRSYSEELAEWQEHARILAEADAADANTRERNLAESSRATSGEW